MRLGIPNGFDKNDTGATGEGERHSPTGILCKLHALMPQDYIPSFPVLELAHLSLRQLWGLIVAPTPHRCLLNCDLSDTVGFTPHICK
jgi:hypothetical protein